MVNYVKLIINNIKITLTFLGKTGFLSETKREPVHKVLLIFYRLLFDLVVFDSGLPRLSNSLSPFNIISP